MSVINQMLKDLEGRQSSSPVDNVAVVSTRISTAKIVAITLLCLVVLNMIGYLVWSLYAENKALKHQAKEAPSIQQKITAQLNKKIDAVKEEQNALKKEQENIQAQPVHHEIIQHSTTLETNKSEQQQVVNNVTPLPETIKPVRVQQVREESAVTQKAVEQKQINLQVNSADNHKTATPSLTISRKKLTAEQLVKQKYEKAQQAINSNDISKAESLYEEILLIKPEHIYARKKLAALWYGRKAYQPAINILQQGLSIQPNNAEYRLMQARIYVELGNKEEAYQVLAVLPNQADTDYQAMLANTAQQLNKHPEAIAAFQYLVTNKPSNARWWLGLAISYDSQGQFTQASQAYQKALINSGLTTNTRNFAQQRIQALGEQ